VAAIWVSVRVTGIPARLIVTVPSAATKHGPVGVVIAGAYT